MALFCACVTNHSIAQNINTEENFPDPNFRDRAEHFIGVAPGGSFTAIDAAAMTGYFSIDYRNISDMTGIEYFTNINALICYNNQLTSLDVSNNTALFRLDCSNNQLTSLTISTNPSLRYLYCDSNQLTSLDVSGASGLVELSCNNNQITEISSLAAQTELGSGDVVDIRYNNLDCGDWDDIVALQNRGVNLDYSPQNSMDPFNCSPGVNINTPDNFPDPNFRSYIEDYMGVPPGGIFTAADAAAMTHFINCSNHNISDMTGIEYFTSVMYLHCEYNQLTSLDLSNNTGLIYFTCQNNQLTCLNIPSNNTLTSFSCYNNQLTSLDVSHNTTIISINCSNNQLISLDVSKNTSLDALYCANNQLTSVSSLISNPGLAFWDNVDVRYNNLSCDDLLDLITLKNRIGMHFIYSPQNGMDPLDCNINTIENFPDPNFRNAVESFLGVSPGGIITASNAVTKTGSFDCSNHTILYASGIEFFSSIDGFDCSDNQLQSLDVYNNPALTYLNCNDNQLSSLNISNTSDTDLLHLTCSNNQISRLDISYASSLIYLDCSDNQLISLNVSAATGLNELLCNNNQLETISNLSTHLGLGTGDVVDLRYNNLDCGDWDAITALQNRGVSLSYSPQNGMDPYDCPFGDNINIPANFPDPNFRSWVENYMGVAPGGAFTAADAAAKTGNFSCGYQNISDMTGIEYFIKYQLPELFRQSINKFECL